MSTESSAPPSTVHPDDKNLTDEDELFYHLQQGNEQVEQKAWEQARTHFEQALKVSPEHGQAKNMLGTVLFKLGHFAEAKRLFYSLLDEHPTDASLYLNLATVLMRQGNLEEAEDLLQTLVQIEPKHDRAHNKLGIVYRQMGRLEESRAHFLLAGSHAQAETVLDVLCNDSGEIVSGEIISSIATDAMALFESSDTPFSGLDLEEDEPLVRDGSSWESYVSHFPNAPVRDEDVSMHSSVSPEDRLDERLSEPALAIDELLPEPGILDTIDLDTESLIGGPDEPEPEPQVERPSQIFVPGFQAPDQPGSDAWLFVSGHAYIRSSILVAATGELTVGECDVPATSNPFLKVEGNGKCLVRVPNVVATVKDVRRMSVRASALAGFEGELSWNRTDALGTAVMELEGNGSVLLNSPQRAILAKVEINAPLHIRKDLFLAWSRDVNVRAANIPGAPGKHVTFEGEGMVILAGSNMV